MGQGGDLLFLVTHWPRKMEVEARGWGWGAKNAPKFCPGFTSQSDHMATANLKERDVQSYHFPEEGALEILWGFERAAPPL